MGTFAETANVVYRLPTKEHISAFLSVCGKQTEVDVFR
jgi:hypothetical protein